MYVKPVNPLKFKVHNNELWKISKVLETSYKVGSLLDTMILKLYTTYIV